MKWDYYPLKLYIKKLSVGGFFGIGLIVNIAIWLMLWLQIPRTEEHIFLHYNILFGIDLIGPATHVFFVPLAGLVILVVNFVAGIFLYNKDKFTAQLLAFAAAFVHIFLIIAASLLVFLNT